MMEKITGTFNVTKAQSKLEYIEICSVLNVRTKKVNLKGQVAGQVAG